MFCEYAYMGDNIPAQQQPVLISSKFDMGESLTPARYYAEDTFATKKEKKKKKKKKKKGGSKFLVSMRLKNFVDNAAIDTTQKLWGEFQCHAYSMVSPKFRSREHLTECEDNSGFYRSTTAWNY